MLLLITVLALATRLPAPWKLDVINDEMHHLESWRNRYGTDDIYPLFLQRLEAGGRFSPARLELIRRVYHSHPLVQRGLIVLVDPQPPVYPALAEATQAVSSSSLLLLRGWSVIFSLLAVYVAYRLGRLLRDEMSGVWLAILVCIGATTQFYAGIGRPYALTQLVILLALWAFVRRMKGKNSTAGLLGWCLLAQAVQWMAWAVVGPVVAVALLQETRTTGLRSLARYWWYGLASALLLGYMLVQLQNPTVANQGGLRSTWEVWWCYAVAGPFSHLGSLGGPALHVGAGVFAGLVIVGGVWVARYREDRWLGWGLLLSAASGLLAALAVGVSVRFAVSYLTPCLLLAALGVRWVAGSGRAGAVAAGVVLVGFAYLSLWHPEDPYERIDQYDVPWSKVAETLKQELKPGERWIVFPANVANNVYRYGPLPEPVMPVNEAAVGAAIEQHPGSVMLTEWPTREPLEQAREIAPSPGAKSRFVLGRVTSGH